MQVLRSTASPLCLIFSFVIVQREKRYNPFEKPVDVLHQRFYFNSGPSVILPRQKILFPFVFKADNAGIYTENWQLNTTPKLCGGAKIIVSLRGIAFKLDKYLPVREEITVSILLFLVSRKFTINER